MTTNTPKTTTAQPTVEAMLGVTEEAIEAIEAARQRQAQATQVCLDEYAVESLIKLLDLADEFIRTAGPTVGGQLREYLDQQWPPLDTGLFIDMLGLTTRDLRHRLRDARDAAQATNTTGTTGGTTVEGGQAQ